MVRVKLNDGIYDISFPDFKLTGGNKETLLQDLRFEKDGTMDEIAKLQRQLKDLKEHHRLCCHAIHTLRAME